MGTDQLVFAPIFLFNFMGLMGILNGQSLQDIKTDLKSNYADVMIRNYQLWPAAQMINFSLVPLQHRVLFAQCVAVVWNTYLSYKTNRTTNDGDRGKEQLAL
jgi:protein Mpv17